MQTLNEFVFNIVATQTVLSVSHLVAFIFLCTVLEVSSFDIRNKGGSAFVCKGATNFDNSFCHTENTSGRNGSHDWLPHITWVIPLCILVLGGVGIFAKSHRTSHGNCKLHIHLVYFLRVFISWLFHVSIVFVLAIFNWALNINQLTLEVHLTCSIGNSTYGCIDGKAKAKSSLNIACFALHVFFVFSNSVELLYYMCRWKEAASERDKIPHVEGRCTP